MTTTDTRRRRPPPWRRQRGSATVEMLLQIPLLVAVILLGVLGFRVAIAHVDVAAAAAAAARDASLQRDPAAAHATASATATTALQASQLTCNPLQVTPDTSSYGPGGTISVDITCTIDVSDLIGLDIPTQISISGSSTHPVDTFRAETPPGATTTSSNGGGPP